MSEIWTFNQSHHPGINILFFAMISNIHKYLISPSGIMD